jgi:putative endonuclease
MGDPRHDLGLAAERAVAAWLERCGWAILARRQRSPGGGEVDLIALDPARILVAVEVRARRSARAGTGTEAIDARRTARIGRTLSAFGRARADGRAHRGVRIDVVTATPVPGPVDHWHLCRYPDAGGE